MDLSTIKTNKLVSREELLTIFSQEQIMEYYFGEPIQLRHAYLNPFREDNTPKCYFFYTRVGVLVFNDFSLGKQFDCFQIANLRAGKSLSSHHMYQQMSNLQPLELPTPTIQYNKEENEQETVIKVEVRPYTQKDLEFWGQFNIDLKTLKKYNVRRVKKVWIYETLTYMDSDRDPCYRYIEGEKIKLYRPFNKDKKFRNNYTQELEGAFVLPAKGNKLIITKSTKDVMVFSTIGLNAVSPRSESSLLSEETMEDLFSRFKQVFIWYDADATGEEKSQKMVSKYPQLVRITHNAQLGKDTSDIVKTHGITKLIELCKQYEIL